MDIVLTVFIYFTPKITEPKKVMSLTFLIFSKIDLHVKNRYGWTSLLEESGQLWGTHLAQKVPQFFC